LGFWDFLWCLAAWRLRAMEDVEVKMLQDMIQDQCLLQAKQLQTLEDEVRLLRERLQAAIERRSRQTASDPFNRIDTAFIRRVEWKLEKCSENVRTLEKNQSIWSSSFTAMGVRDMQLEFFPKGRENSQKGFCALFLWCPGYVRMKYCLQVGNHVSSDEDVFTSRMGHGHSNFCILEAQFDDKDCLVIGLEVLAISWSSDPGHGLKLVNTGPESAVRREAAVLHNRDKETVEWKIRDIRRRMLEVPNGVCLSSPLFSAAGVRDMHLEFYPNGLDGGKAGYCGFYVRCPSGEHTLKVTLFVGSARRGPSKTEFNGNAAKGLPEFCRLDEQLVEGEEDLITGIILQNPIQEQEEDERRLEL